MILPRPFRMGGGGGDYQTQTSLKIKNDDKSHQSFVQNQRNPFENPVLDFKPRTADAIINGYIPMIGAFQ